MPEVGLEGQAKLKKAKVLIVGAGGLGSPAALYLAAAGVGNLGIADHDKIELSNLHRQIMHATMDVGRKKTESAKESITSLNPETKVNIYADRLSFRNALKILRGYNIIIDGSDNFLTRYAVNDVCISMGKPCIYGSVAGFEGQVSVFYPGKGPCYACLLPKPPSGMPLSCSEEGVLNVVPGVIGSIQAAEAMKLILGRGRSLIGRLLVFNGLEMTFKDLKISRRSGCKSCGHFK